MTRGIWLIVLELTVVRLGVMFNFDMRLLGFLQVIWVIGVSMIVLGALIYLPVKVVGAFGLLMIALHNLLDGIRVESWRGPESPVPALSDKLWLVLHQPFEAFPIAGFPSPVVFVIYPLIPWVGVMAAGYAFGVVYDWDAQRRRRLLLIIGGVVSGTLHRAARDQCLWRSVAVVAAEECVVHAAVFCEHDEVSAVAALFVDDAWTIDSRAGCFRNGKRRRAHTGVLCDVWTRAVVLLSAAMAACAYDFNRAALGLRQADAVVVSIADGLDRWDAEYGVQSRGGLLVLDCGGVVAVSGV